MKLFVIIFTTCIFKWFTFNSLKLPIASSIVIISDLILIGYWLFRGFQQVASANELYLASEALVMTKRSLKQLLWLGSLPIVGAFLLSEKVIEPLFYIDLVLISSFLIGVVSWALITTISNAFKRLEGTSAMNSRAV